MIGQGPDLGAHALSRVVVGALANHSKATEETSPFVEVERANADRRGRRSEHARARVLPGQKGKNKNPFRRFRKGLASSNQIRTCR